MSQNMPRGTEIKVDSGAPRKSNFQLLLKCFFFFPWVIQSSYVLNNSFGIIYYLLPDPVFQWFLNQEIFVKEERL